MNTIEMLNKVQVGQKAVSESLKATVYKDKGKGVVVAETNKNLQLNSFVLNATDWKIIIERITDYNELFRVIDTEEGATMYIKRNETGRLGFLNKYSPKSVNVTIEELTEGKWFKGRLTMKELTERGLV